MINSEYIEKLEKVIIDKNKKIEILEEAVETLRSVIDSQQMQIAKLETQVEKLIERL